MITTIIEPFTDNGDLLKIKVNILTNPPYLARNKSMNKELFDKYNINDLYKCFIEILLDGILIVPLNFIYS